MYTPAAGADTQAVDGGHQPRPERRILQARLLCIDSGTVPESGFGHREQRHDADSPRAHWRARDRGASPSGARRGPGLPAEVYTSQDFFDIEQRRLFPRAWVGIAFDTGVPAPGDAIPLTVCGLPVILVRDHGGEVRVLHNVCRHRATIVLERAARGLRSRPFRPDTRRQGRPESPTRCCRTPPSPSVPSLTPRTDVCLPI